MKINKKIALLICVLIVGFSTQITFVGTIQGDISNYLYKTILGQIAWRFIPVVITLLIFYKPNQILIEFGLNKEIYKAIKFAFLFTLPMLLGCALLGKFNSELSFFYLLAKSFKDGLGEEIFFRAFLFGQLYRHFKLGFITASILPALLFGIGHLYQGDSFSSCSLVFFITFIGAIWFSWLYTEWNFNVWITLIMHFLMNFYWSLFSIENGATGGLISDIPRAITIFLSIYFTIKMMKKTNGKLMINKHNLIFQ